MFGLGAGEAFLIVIVAVTAGLLVVASGQVSLALREIALNTRREADGESRGALLLVAKVNNALGGLMVAFGGLVGLGAMIATCQDILKG